MLNDEQEIIRQNLIQYLENTGTKSCIIAQRTNIPVTVLSRFKNGRKSLYPDSLKQLKEYLSMANFDTVNCVVKINRTFLR